MGRFRFLVSRRTLYLIAGVVWILVGFMLMNFARIWLEELDQDKVWLYTLLGFILAIIKYRFVFVGVVAKNISRIETMNERVGFYLFIPPASYFLVVAMMALGILLRHSDLPKQYLVILYTGIGFSLFLSSFMYFRPYVQYSCDINQRPKTKI